MVPKGLSPLLWPPVPRAATAPSLASPPRLEVLRGLNERPARQLGKASYVSGASNPCRRSSRRALRGAEALKGCSGLALKVGFFSVPALMVSVPLAWGHHPVPSKAAWDHHANPTGYTHPTAF